MARFVFSSLRTRLLLLVLLAATPALGLTLYTAAEQRRLSALEIHQRALQLVRLAASDQKEMVSQARQLLHVLVRLPAVADRSLCNGIFADLLQQHPRYANLGVARPDGHVFCSGIPLTQPITVSDRAWFRRTLQSRDFTIGGYQISRITGKASVNFSYPVLDASTNVRAVVFAALDLTWLNKLAAEAQLPPGSTLSILDHQGIVLARYPDPERWVGRSVPDAPVFEAIRTQEADGTRLHHRANNIVEAADLDGTPLLFAFTSLDDPANNKDVYVSIGIPRTIAFAEADRLLMRNLAALGLVTALALAAAWVGGDLFLLRRLSTLVSASKKLAAGDLSTRTGLSYAEGELGQLAHAFDEMASSLQVQETERRRLEEEVRHRERLEDILRFRSEFIVNVSHELRTPLNAVIGFSELLEDEKFGRLNEKQKRYVQNIWASGTHLLNLINDILDLSKIEAGKLALRLESIHLPNALRAVVTLLRPQAEAKGLVLTLSVDERVNVLAADPIRFNQILYNLLSNAVKYTPAGGSVTMMAYPTEPDAVEIEVKDTGIGFRAEDVPKLFQPFTQLDTSLGRRHQGTGLGLALTKNLVELHGGSIRAQSAGEGQGSTFTFTLPIRASDQGGG